MARGPDLPRAESGSPRGTPRRDQRWDLAATNKEL